MIANVLLHEIMFPKGIFSKVNSEEKVFVEFANKNSQKEIIENKLKKLHKKYHNFMIYLPLEILKNDSLTLSSFKENDQKSSIFRLIIRLFNKFIAVIIKYIMTLSTSYKKKKMKYTYLFSLSNTRNDIGYDNVIIIFSLAKTMIDESTIKSIVKEFSGLLSGVSMMNRIIKKADFQFLKKLSNEYIKGVFHCYFLDFFKKNDTFLNLFFPTKAHRFLSKPKKDYFMAFFKKIFHLKNPTCIIEYMRQHTLKHAYRIKNSDYNFIMSMDMCNIMLPQTSKIIEKTIRHINMIRNIERESETHGDDDTNGAHELFMSAMTQKSPDYTEELNLLITAISDQTCKRQDEQMLIKDEVITINRLLVKYNIEIRRQMSFLFHNYPSDLDKINKVLNKMMFKFYCIYARSPDSTLSTVGEAIHRERIRDRLDIIKPSDNTTKFNFFLKRKELNNLTYYDIYRLISSYEVINAFSCRSYLVSIFEMLLENSISIYNHTKNLANNIFIIGDPSAGKDFLLELLESVLISKTMIKESRASPCADSSESHGRHDDEIIFNVEKSMSNLMNSKKYNGTGDTQTKDIMTSARSVARVLTLGANGSRVTKTIINEKIVLMYNAANPSLISKIDRGIFERYIWIAMMPTTFANSIETINLIIEQKLTTSALESSSKQIVFKNDQRFIQMASYELSKMANICSNDICQTGALYVIQYILECLHRDMKKYGCMPLKQRKIENILTLAKCHMIRRNIIKTFFINNDPVNYSYTPKTLYKNIIKKSRLYIKLRDLILAFGQLSSCLGIFSIGELQIITALRRIFIKHSYEMMMNGESFSESQDFTFSKKRVNYVRFPNNIPLLAKMCMENILKVWKKEEDAIHPINQDMFEDCLRQLFIRPDENKINVNYILRESTNIQYNKREKTLFISNDQSKKSRKESVFFVKAKHIYIHVMYLTRVCDPLMQCYPWTKTYPKTWTPVVTEDSLLKRYFENFINLKHQDKKKKFVYKLKRKRLSDNPFFAKMKNEQLYEMRFHEFDYIEEFSIMDNDYFFIKNDRGESRKRSNKTGITSLNMNIDKLSRLSIHYSIFDVLTINDHTKDNKNNNNKRMRIS